MQGFMVSFTFTKSVHDPDVSGLIPAEQAKVAQLKDQKIIDDVWVKKDLSGGYIRINAESDRQLQVLLNSLPLSPYLSFSVVELVV